MAVNSPSADEARGDALPSAEDWPGRERRCPGKLDRYYLALRGLSTCLQKEIRTELHGKSGLTILDLGCGDKPYYPWFRPFAARYVGIDGSPGPYVDQVCSAERLAVANDSIDAVICTQVLEHVDEPHRVIEEISRVLRPGGLCFLTTHGVFPYHAVPEDYWRWTHEGLRRLFAAATRLDGVRVIPTEGIVSCLAALVDFYVDNLSSRRFLGFLKWTLHPLLGMIPRRLDRYAAWLFESHPLAVNYLVVARKRQV